MGQRHQIFIQVPNPVKVFNMRNPIEKKRYMKMFGGRNNTVLAFHHQWLYGLSAVFNVNTVLQFVKNCKLGSYRNMFDKNTIAHAFSTPEQYVQFITDLMSIITDPNHPRGCGIEGFWCLNETEPDMRHSYDCGDNNDGITIIDALTGKYCFMNIGGDSTIEQAEPNVPLSATEYGSLYYPQSIEAIEAFLKHEEERSGEPYTEAEVKQYIYKGTTKEKRVASNIKDCKAIFKKVSKYEVLTMGEIKKIFPRLAK